MRSNLAILFLVLSFLAIKTNAGSSSTISYDQRVTFSDPVIDEFGVFTVTITAPAALGPNQYAFVTLADQDTYQTVGVGCSCASVNATFSSFQPYFTGDTQLAAINASQVSTYLGGLSNDPDPSAWDGSNAHFQPLNTCPFSNGGAFKLVQDVSADLTQWNQIYAAMQTDSALADNVNAALQDPMGFMISSEANLTYVPVTYTVSFSLIDLAFACANYIGISGFGPGIHHGRSPPTGAQYAFTLSYIVNGISLNPQVASSRYIIDVYSQTNASTQFQFSTFDVTSCESSFTASLLGFPFANYLADDQAELWLTYKISYSGVPLDTTRGFQIITNGAYTPDFLVGVEVELFTSAALVKTSSFQIVATNGTMSDENTNPSIANGTVAIPAEVITCYGLEIIDILPYIDPLTPIDGMGSPPVNKFDDPCYGDKCSYLVFLKTAPRTLTPDGKAFTTSCEAYPDWTNHFDMGFVPYDCVRNATDPSQIGGCDLACNDGSIDYVVSTIAQLVYPINTTELTLTASMYSFYSSILVSGSIPGTDAYFSGQHVEGIACFGTCFQQPYKDASALYMETCEHNIESPGPVSGWTNQDGCKDVADTLFGGSSFTEPVSPIVPDISDSDMCFFGILDRPELIYQLLFTDDSGTNPQLINLDTSDNHVRNLYYWMLMDSIVVQRADTGQTMRIDDFLPIGSYSRDPGITYYDFVLGLSSETNEQFREFRMGKDWTGGALYYKNAVLDQPVNYRTGDWPFSNTEAPAPTDPAPFIPINASTCTVDKCDCIVPGPGSTCLGYRDCCVSSPQSASGAIDGFCWKQQSFLTKWFQFFPPSPSDTFTPGQFHEVIVSATFHLPVEYFDASYGFNNQPLQNPGRRRLLSVEDEAIQVTLQSRVQMSNSGRKLLSTTVLPIAWQITPEFPFTIPANSENVFLTTTSTLILDTSLINSTILALTFTGSTKITTSDDWELGYLIALVVMGAILILGMGCIINGIWQLMEMVEQDPSVLTKMFRKPSKNIKIREKDDDSGTD